MNTNSTDVKKHKISHWVMVISALCLTTAMPSYAKHHTDYHVSYSHGHKVFHHATKHNNRHHAWHRPIVIHRHSHDALAVVGGAILGAVIVSSIDNDETTKQVTVVQQNPSTMIYRQLADGSCYHVSYDANGVEYLQRVDKQFCGVNN
jgi:zinc transporter ZupT